MSDVASNTTHGYDEVVNAPPNVVALDGGSSMPKFDAIPVSARAQFIRDWMKQMRAVNYRIRGVPLFRGKNEARTHDCPTKKLILLAPLI